MIAGEDDKLPVNGLCIKKFHVKLERHSPSRAVFYKKHHSVKL